MKARMAGSARKAFCLFCMIWFAVMLHAPALAAQVEPVFRLDMDSLNLQKGVSSTVVVSITNAQGAQITSFDGLEMFDVYSQGTSTSSSMVNNVVTYQADAYYTIIPKTTGQFTLKASIVYEGKMYETNALEISVAEGADASGTMPDLFAKTILSHDEAYLGEKVILTYEVYSRANVEGLGIIEHIAIDDMMVKELPGQQITAEAVYIEGTKYIKYVVNQMIIDPLKTGTLAIPSFTMQVNVVVEMSGFGGFSGIMQATTAQYVHTEEAQLLVKPLPVEGRPDDFSGIVGELNLTGHYSRTELNYGDSLALQVEMAGSCNLDGIKNVFDGTMSGFTVFENQKSSEESIKNNAYHAQKAFEAVLIPETNGLVNVPPVSVSYFSPTTGQYEVAEIPETTINVLGEMPAVPVGGGSQPLSSSYETVVINQVNYADGLEEEFVLRIDKALARVLAVGLLIALVACAMIFGLVRARKKRKTPLTAMYRRLMRAKDVNEIYNCFNEMIKHCFRINVKACAKNSIAASLPDSDLAFKVVGIVDYMESPEAYGNAGGESLKKKIKELYRQKLRQWR